MLYRIIYCVTLLFTLPLYGKISIQDNPFQYDGEYQKGPLIYLNARYYDVNIQRFLTEDRMDTDDKSLFDTEYDAFGDNPVMDEDPSGYVKVPFNGKIIDLGDNFGMTDLIKYSAADAFKHDISIQEYGEFFNAILKEVLKNQTLDTLPPLEPIPLSSSSSMPAFSTREVASPREPQPDFKDNNHHLKSLQRKTAELFPVNGTVIKKKLLEEVSASEYKEVFGEVPRQEKSLFTQMTTTDGFISLKKQQDRLFLVKVQHENVEYRVLVSKGADNTIRGRKWFNGAPNTSAHYLIADDGLAPVVNYTRWDDD